MHALHFHFASFRDIAWYENSLDLLALIPFKLQHSQLISLWKPSHCGYEKWYCHFYTCQIIKGDIWLQFEYNEKNPPGGSVIQKNQNKILKSWYLHYWRSLRGARDVKISGWTPLTIFWWFWSTNIEPKLRNIQKSVRKHGFLMIFFSLLTAFGSFYNLEGNLSPVSL